MPLAVRLAETERGNFLLLLSGLIAGTLLTCLQRNGVGDLLLRCIVGTAGDGDVLHCLAEGSTDRKKAQQKPSRPSGRPDAHKLHNTRFLAAA